MPRGVKKRGLPLSELWCVVGILPSGDELPAKYKAHVLTGNRAGQYECHIRPDWLLVWKKDDDNLILMLTNTGTHSDLFG